MDKLKWLYARDVTTDSRAERVIEDEPDIAGIAALIGDPARARVLLALLGGHSLPAGVLAAESGISAATMSVHLAKLVDGELLSVERRGRQRYFRLAGPVVAETLAALARISPSRPLLSLREHNRAEALRFARSCYDHLAGEVGVALMDALLSQGLISGPHVPHPGAAERHGHEVEPAYQLTVAGRRAMAAFGLDLAQFSCRREVVGICEDWSHARLHLAGSLGAALTQRMLDMDWLRRDPRIRILRVTTAGRGGLHDVFEVALDVERDRAQAT